MNIYYENVRIKIRSMTKEDARIIFDTYMSYGWHPSMETYENYLKEQEAGERIVFIPEYEGRVAGICTLVLRPSEGPFAGNGWPEIVDLCVFFDMHNKGIGNMLLDVAEHEAAKLADHVFLAVGVHSGYGAAQRIYVKRGYLPDGSGVWYQGKQLEQYAPCVNDDDLLLFMSKELKKT
ncbi:MAG: GNAT family N-acetyltransferase [Oscillospiraceae bacterium]|nr:GNAT family N-acetyltransferase [Oscillospiraceae bacterium]